VARWDTTGKIHVIGKTYFVRLTSEKGLREDRVLQTVVATKTQRRADELVALVRLRLNGHYARVPITIERDGDTWAAVAHIKSAITRGRIEFAARKVGELNALAPGPS
jgi:hypothetical protein